MAILENTPRQMVKKDYEMTARENKIRLLRTKWAETLKRKGELIKELWALEFIETETREKLIKYGAFENEGGMESPQEDANVG